MAGMLDFAVANAGNKLNSYLSNNYQPGAYGEMQGYLKAQKEGREQAADIREERKLGMAEEKFGWERDAHAEEQLLQEGMRLAAQDGGYSGVIKYLEKANPERALIFTSAKEKLDSQIMENDVMRAIKIPAMQQDALLDSYGKLGKMGAALLQAPAEFRDAMYEKMLPVAKLINPSMPDNLQEAAPMFLLAAAQATPVNQLFKHEDGVYQAQHTVGKLNADIAQALKSGATLDGDTEADEGLRALYAEREKAKNQSLASTLNLNKTQMTLDKNVYNNTTQMTKNLGQVSIIDKKYAQSYAQMQGALELLESDPKNPLAMQQLARSFIKANAGGNPSDADSAIAYNATSYEQLKLFAESYTSGKAVPLNREAINDFKAVINEVKDSMVARQKNIESQFETQAQTYPGQVDWKSVVKPSEYFNQALTELNANKKMMATGEIPPDLQAKAEQAIKAGAKPEAVQARIQELMQQRAQSTQEILQPKLTPADYDQGQEGAR